MDDEVSSLDIRRNVFLLIGQVIIILACLWYIGFIYKFDIYPDKMVGNTYHATQCLITEENITIEHSRYRANFLLNYSANGTQYKTWVSGNGLDVSFKSDRASQTEVLDLFNVGTAYPCWINPNDPRIAVLVLRKDWDSTFSLFIPSVILLIALYYLFSTFFQLINIIKSKQ